MEERIIVFTLYETVTGCGEYFYDIVTKHRSGRDENCYNLYANEIFKNMADISEVLNNKGYAVLFEVC